ncbi:MAG TPA: DUF4062 domain-containing protein [Chthoniobacteraceae bacterium]|jgi:hypothetical protein|nr:DUF4062 domain-containing protein [Chthoniobacteraceae bacterium]
MGEVLKVFISATTADLGAVRAAVRDFFSDHQQYKPVEQEHFGPAAETLLEMDRRKLAGCDAVLHLVGECYGHEPPLAGGSRRSYTQLEHDHALGKPLYLFVCEDSFPYAAHAPEPEEKQVLQRAHRQAILAGHHKYERIADLAALAEQLRLVDFADIRKNEEIRVLRANLVDERDAIRLALSQHIRRRSAEETGKLDHARDWEKIAEWEAMRDQQLADVDRFLDQIDRAFAQNEASANYRTAGQILAERGAAEALRFLQAKSGEREARLALHRRARAMEDQAIRELLREKLLEASLREKELQFDQAEAVYREVIRDGGAWSEPRHELARLLSERGIVIEPAAGNAKLREAVEVWRGLLHLQPREEDPESWAKTQNNLATALWNQGTRAEGAESLRLLGEAVTAYRAALEVYTRTQLPQAWAMTQNNLATALGDQGKRAEGAESLRLLGEAVTAYRAALEVRTRAQLPQAWARTQNNLAIALCEQGTRAEGAESLRLLGEAVTAYRAALEVRTRAQLPYYWRRTQGNLAISLHALADRSETAEAERLRAEAEAIDQELASEP